MRLTAFTDYSLRVLTYLAVEPDRRATIAEIANAFAISENHLMKVVHFLGKHGFLTNVRGKGGGMTLARPAREINVGAVVRLTEADALPAECFDSANNTCVITPACHLRKVLQEAVDAFYAVLGQYTLADLVGERQRLVPPEQQLPLAAAGAATAAASLPMRTRQSAGPDSRYSQVKRPAVSAWNWLYSGLGSWSLTSCSASPGWSVLKRPKISGWRS